MITAGVDALALEARLRTQLERGLATLPDKPEENVESTLAALWHAAAGDPVSVAAALRAPRPAIDAAAAARLEALVARRLAGEPLAHLTGRQRFLGVELLAGPGALIPRAETEILGRAALAALEKCAATEETPRVLDVCTGSGNLAVALARHVPRARVWASDLSADAVELARRNAEWAGVADRVELRAGDLFQPFAEPAFERSMHLVVCNPPYISSAKVDAMPAETGGHEPRLAFDGGPLGIRILDRLAAEAPRYLCPGGLLIFEVGLGQARGMRRRIEHLGWRDVVEAADEQGNVRVLGARVAPAP